jgi:hypothetical protein
LLDENRKQHILNSTNILLPVVIAQSHYYAHLLDVTEVESNSPGAFGVVRMFGGSPSGSCAIINTARARLSKRHLYQQGK